MSLLNQASLIQIPSGYKDGTLYSAKPINGDGDFTFSRGSNLAATRVNSEGLIEKGRENVLLQSNTFDTTWTNVNTSETSGQNGYDGTNNAWKLTKTAASGRLQQATFSAGLYCFSLYLKADTINWVQLYLDTTTATDPNAFFDLQNGLVGSTNDNIDASIEDVGNGWYRCSLVGNASTTFTVMIFPAEADNDKSATSGSILIQDAQLELGLVATDVITTTTTTAQAGILEDMPRLDYSGGASCGSLLLEPQRTNTISQSEYFGGQQISSSANLEINTTTSPQGIQNASTLTSNLSSAAVKFLTFAGIQAGASDDSVFSLFVKKYNHRYIQLINNGDNDLYANFDVQDGVVGDVGSETTASIEDYGNGWYRCSMVLDGSQNINAAQRIYLADSLTQSYASSSNVSSGNGVYIWGAMQENDASYPTSYIPTYGAVSTRGQDACFKTGISSLIGQTAGTIFLEMLPVGSTNSYTERLIKIYGGGQEIGLQRYANSRLVGYGYLAGPNNEWTFDIADVFTSTTQSVKIAMAYASNDVAIYVNGVQKNTDSSASMFSALSVFTFAEDTAGNLLCPQNVKQAILFPTRLTNDELAELTTL
jgi:hypothetical protein